MEDTLETLVAWLQKLQGAPACLLTVGVCIVTGYILRLFKRFPNDAIPIAVILIGGVFYPLIADDKNDWTLRVWIIRNAGIGLIFGMVSWLFHNQVLSRIEDKIPGLKTLLGGNSADVPIKQNPPADPPTVVTPNP